MERPLIEEENRTIFNTLLFGYFFFLGMLGCARAILDADGSIPFLGVPDDSVIHPWMKLEL